MVVDAFNDPQARLSYHFKVGSRAGDKYLCVVVRALGEDAFVLTAYLYEG